VAFSDSVEPVEAGSAAGADDLFGGCVDDAAVGLGDREGIGLGMVLL